MSEAKKDAPKAEAQKETKTQAAATTALASPVLGAGRNALVTGANRGLGLEFVRTLAARGWHVIGTARRPADAKDLNEIAKASGGKVAVLALDVESEASIKALGPAADAVLHTWSKDSGKAAPLHFLVNNAGVMPMTKIADSTAAEWTQVFRICQLAPLLVTQALLANLRAATSPSAPAKVLNIGAGLASFKHVAHLFHMNIYTPAYSAAKAGLHMLTRCFALEFPDVLFFSVHPGWVATDLGNHAGAVVGRRPPLTVPVAVGKVLAVADSATMADHQGLLFNFDGALHDY